MSKKIILLYYYIMEKQKKEMKMKMKNISESEMKKLMTHSKMHKGGMSSKHIKNMIKFMSENNDSFIVAHNKSKKLDKNNNNNKNKNYKK